MGTTTKTTTTTTTRIRSWLRLFFGTRGRRERKRRQPDQGARRTTRGRSERGVGATQPGRSFNLNPVQLLSGRSSHLSSIKLAQEYHISLICTLQCNKLFIVL